MRLPKTLVLTQPEPQELLRLREPLPLLRADELCARLGLRSGARRCLLGARRPEDGQFDAQHECAGPNTGTKPTTQPETGTKPKTKTKAHTHTVPPAALVGLACQVMHAHIAVTGLTRERHSLVTLEGKQSIPLLEGKHGIPLYL